MKTDFSIAGLRATAFASAAFISLTLAAEAKAPPRPLAMPVAAVRGGNIAGGTVANPVAAAGALQEAYGLLATADHDYNGHRARAMKQIESAAKLLGITLKGDGKVREPQGTSDAQLRSAQALLEQVSTGITGAGLTHLQQAVKQLNVALAIR
jgi:hypothetical protein